MKHYLFTCTEGNINEGEEFLIGAHSKEEAIEIAVRQFDLYIRYICELSDEEAEASGLDEY